MIDTMGKILERLIYTCLENHLERETSSLFDIQYSVRRKRSSIDAFNKLTDISEKYIEGDSWMYAKSNTAPSLPLMLKRN